MIHQTLLAFLLSLAGAGDVQPKEAVTEPYLLDREKKQVTHRDAKGKVVWSTSFDEDIGGVRPPHLLWDKQRVYLTHKDGVTALDTKSGKRLWHTEGPQDGLLLSNELLLGTGSLANKDGTFSPWLFAYDTTKGIVTFKTSLAKDMSDPQSVQEIASLFLIQNREAPGGEGNGMLVDRQGKIRHRFDRQVVDGKKYGEDLVVVTSKNIVRVNAKDKVAWTVLFEYHQWIAGGGLADVPGGDVIAYRFGYIRDSGVDLIRFDPSTGKEKWKIHCQGLRVRHSEYYHTADVAIEGQKVRVTSNGSYGTFIEILELKTGRQLERTSKGR
jgi:outer membrane protein assembly factor BamB